MSATTQKIRWTTVDEGKFRSALGTIWARASGWYFYPPGTRKSEGGVFKSKAAAIRFATGKPE